MGIGPGNSAFDRVAKYHNDTDPCQYSGKDKDYELPDYCRVYRSKNVYYVKDVNGKTLYKIQ
jgi:hypothetical protein